jgi:hypothetical protein
MQRRGDSHKPDGWSHRGEDFSVGGRVHLVFLYSATRATVGPRLAPAAEGEWRFE